MNDNDPIFTDRQFFWIGVLLACLVIAGFVLGMS